MKRILLTYTLAFILLPVYGGEGGSSPAEKKSLLIDYAINSMNAGKNVLVEKPMATCLEECDAMLEAEKKNHVVMGCIAQNRFRNSIYKLKKVVDSGLAGKNPLCSCGFFVVERSLLL